MPSVHPRPARTALLVGCQWFLENFPQLSGGGVLIATGATLGDYGTPTAVALPVGLLATWPLGVVLRETAHSIRCWRIRQQRQYAEFLRSSCDQHRSTFVTAERVPEAPLAQLERPPQAELDPARPRVIEAEVVPPAAERDR